MFCWVELLLAKTLTSVAAKPIAATMTRTASTSGYELGLLAAAGALTIVPGAIVDLFRAQLHRQGLRARPRLRGGANRHAAQRGFDGLGWMAWTWQTAAFFGVHRAAARRHGHLGVALAGRRAAARHARRCARRAATGCSSRCWRPRYIHLIWLALFGTPLWGAAALSLIVAVIVFRWA